MPSISRRRPRPRRLHSWASLVAAAIALGIANGASAQTAAVDAPRASESTPAAGPGQPVVIPGAEQFDLRSGSGLEYRIFLAAPKGPPPSAGFPVIYLTDGNANFPILLAAARKQSREGSRAVVVGIGYPSEDPQTHRERRAYDLTPPASEEWRKSNPRGMAPLEIGGDRQFLEFIESELKPAIEARCKIDRTRQTLFGHSFGGLFTLRVLFNRPETFQTYLAASPSLWWNDGSVLAEAKDFIKRRAGDKMAARVLITVGERERQPSPTASEQRAEAGETPRMAESAKDLADLLNAANISGLTVEFREFPEEEHGSVVLPAASRGARFALDDESRE